MKKAPPQARQPQARQPQARQPQARHSEGPILRGPLDARAVAITVLHRVAYKGAYASVALDAEIARAKLDARDASLTTEIVYGVLRVLPDLDRAIARHVSRNPERMDELARCALRAAAYQLAHLGRLPTHAIVDETVTFLRKARSPGLAGFANAVLRKLAAERPAEPTPPRVLCVPDWVRAELVRSLGDARAQAMLVDRPLPPPLGLRVTQGTTARDALVARLREQHPAAEIAASELSPLGICARRAGAPRALSGYARGELSVQEEGAQLVALALGAQANERIADVCAGHGGKSTLLAIEVGDGGHVTAIDVDERKLERIPAELTRLHVPTARVSYHAIDVSVGSGGLSELFDRVLVDAPCTGLGTVQRRPELLLRLTPEDSARMAELQLRILQRASGWVRPGGVLAYAVCSPTAAEGLGVATRLESELPELQRIVTPLAPGLPAQDADGVLRIGPWMASPGALSSPDAYQVIAWRRVL